MQFPIAYRGFMDLQHHLPLFLVILFTSALAVLIAKILNWGKAKHHLHLPPGKLGLPLIGETISFLRSYKVFKGRKWMEEKVSKYGPVFKTSLMGCPTVVLAGEEGNRFLLQNDVNSIVNSQPITVSRIIGKYNLLELTGEEHKRIRGALMQFLRPEALQRFVGRLENIVVQHFSEFWEGKESVTVLPLMKKLTFQVACDLLFSVTDGEERDILEWEFTRALKGAWSLPLNLPWTTFGRSLDSRSRICRRLEMLLKTRRRELEQGDASPTQDLMSCLLTMSYSENEKPLTEEEIIDNMILLFLAAHDTTSALLTNVIRMLALHPHIYQNILQEHTEISGGKEANDPIRWEEMQKMKYTWKVAQETLRVFPPAFGGFRKAIKDVEYKGYIVPSGWQLFWVTSTHMDAEIFKEPAEFDPCHFDDRIRAYNFVPFGGGARVCPGYDLVKMEVRIFLHHLLSKYRWELLNSKEGIICDPLAIPSVGLPIKILPKREIY